MAYRLGDDVHLRQDNPMSYSLREMLFWSTKNKIVDWVVVKEQSVTSRLQVIHVMAITESGEFYTPVFVRNTVLNTIHMVTNTKGQELGIIPIGEYMFGITTYVDRLEILIVVREYSPCLLISSPI